MTNPKTIDPAEEYANRMSEVSRNCPSKSYGSITSSCNPLGYNWELHQDMGEQKCSTCQRLYREHNPQEFAEHWGKEGIPYYAEIHHSWGDRKCSICERSFSAHSAAEFCHCWDKLGRPKE